MAIVQRSSLQITIFLFLFVFNGVSTLYAKAINLSFEGGAKLVGSVISTPCSIAMTSRYQTVDFSSLALPKLSTISIREQEAHPFEIELRDCGSVYSAIDSKTWTIRFDGQRDEKIDAFLLEGPSQGLVISVLDNAKNTLMPGKTYSLFDSILRQEKSGQTLFLRYFIQLKLSGKPLKSGQYKGLVRFFIDYQ
ncbi:MAG TPA: fimbrial protein [Providencia sp.]|uniref:fimbrial protein n=1 Tax=Providencia sp. TaxID=589 RepID=UPI000E9E86EB|nr:fimbrial protein [Providencia sp.]MBP6082687.1 type 1 fimbrial protein [Providencia sp.]HBO22408.1 fimbrial protein [Providencia sp.]